MSEEDFGVQCSSNVGYMHPHNAQKQGPHKIDGPVKFDDLNDIHHKGGDKVAKELAKKVRVLCWVMTSPDNLRSKAKAVKESWGKRCNTLLFMSSEEDKELPAVGLGRTDVWTKTRAAWKYIHDYHINDADWFFKADDETFAIVENLRLLLAPYNTENAHYFGRWYKPAASEYHSEAAGYVFSRKTLQFFRQAMDSPDKCSEVSIGEEGNVGACLAAVGIHPDDSRDSQNREKFHPFPPENHVVPALDQPDSWLHKYNKFPVVNGPGCCSDNSITFHNINAQSMYILEYLVYHLRPYGVENSLSIKV